MLASEIAMDEIIELMQHKLKSMHFKPDKDSLISHSHNVPLLQQCQIFVQTNYVRHKSVFSLDKYNNNTNNEDTELVYTKVNKSNKSDTTPEKIVIDEILNLVKICEEIPARKISRNNI